MFTKLTKSTFLKEISYSARILRKVPFYKVKCKVKVKGQGQQTRIHLTKECQYFLTKLIEGNEKQERHPNARSLSRSRSNVCLDFKSINNE